MEWYMLTWNRKARIFFAKNHQEVQKHLHNYTGRVFKEYEDAHEASNAVKEYNVPKVTTSVV